MESIADTKFLLKQEVWHLLHDPGAPSCKIVGADERSYAPYNSSKTGDALSSGLCSIFHGLNMTWPDVSTRWTYEFENEKGGHAQYPWVSCQIERYSNKPNFYRMILSTQERDPIQPWTYSPV